MSGKKKVLMVLVILLLLGSVAAGLVWNLTHYVAVDFRFYPRDAKILDLRGETISVSQLRKALPADAGVLDFVGRALPGRGLC